jgi:hypothetical protein
MKEKLMEMLEPFRGKSSFSDLDRHILDNHVLPLCADIDYEELLDPSPLREYLDRNIGSVRKMFEIKRKLLDGHIVKVRYVMVSMIYSFDNCEPMGGVPYKIVPVSDPDYTFGIVFDPNRREFPEMSLKAVQCLRSIFLDLYEIGIAEFDISYDIIDTVAMFIKSVKVLEIWGRGDRTAFAFEKSEVLNDWEAVHVFLRACLWFCRSQTLYYDRSALVLPERYAKLASMYLADEKDVSVFSV